MVTTEEHSVQTDALDAKCVYVQVRQEAIRRPF